MVSMLDVLTNQFDLLSKPVDPFISNQKIEFMFANVHFLTGKSIASLKPKY